MWLQADANEELHGSLRSMKGTNRRLVEEVQKQTEELSDLTQKRLQEMEKLSKQEEFFSREKATWAHEAQNALEEERRRLDKDFCEMKGALSEKLDRCWPLAERMLEFSLSYIYTYIYLYIVEYICIVCELSVYIFNWQFVLLDRLRRIAASASSRTDMMLDAQSGRA